MRTKQPARRRPASLLLLVAASCALVLSSCSRAVRSPVGEAAELNRQYKRISRDIVTQIANGDIPGALAMCDAYEQAYPGDQEVCFVRALAYSADGQPGQAMASVRKALDRGLPFGRFLAGPRDLLEPLYSESEFRELAENLSAGLIHGPVVGNITDQGASFWVRTAGRSAVTVQAFTDLNSDSVSVSAPGWTDPASDYTTVIDILGLEPGTRYYYKVTIDGESVPIDPVPSFRTAPPVGEGTRLDIGFGGGAGFTPWHEHMWDQLYRQEFEAFLLLGDNVYIDTPTVAETQRYCYYRRQSRPEYRRFASSTPLYAIWDDHDFGTDDVKSSLEFDDPPWKMDVLRIFTQNFVNPSYGEGEGKPGCYFSFQLGNVQFFMLDCRFYRQDPQEVEEPTMLGPAQKDWLFRGLRDSDAVFKVIASSVPWAPGVKPGSKDTWDGHPAEREGIFRFLEENRIGGVILISADRHRSDARRIPRPDGYPLYDFMSSRLTNIHTHGLVEDAEGSEFLFGYNEKCSYGRLTFDTVKADPEVTYRIFSIDGDLKGELTLHRSELSYE